MELPGMDARERVIMALLLEADEDELSFLHPSRQTHNIEMTDEVIDGAVESFNEGLGYTDDLSIELARLYNHVGLCKTADTSKAQWFKNRTFKASDEESRVALQHEVDWHCERQTWEETAPPEGEKILESGFILRKKYDADGTLCKYDAKLVVASNFKLWNQYELQNLGSRFMKSSRLLVGVASHYGWPVHHLDGNSYWETTRPSKPIYISAPRQMKLQSRQNVLLLKNGLYGLAHSGEQWEETMTGELSDLGFKWVEGSSIFVNDEKSIFMALGVYDVLVTGKDAGQVSDMVKLLVSNFAFGDLGPLSSCLGMDFEINDVHSVISQRSFLNEALSRFRLNDAAQEGEGFPQTPDIGDIAKESVALSSKVPFWRALASLALLAEGTRPDIRHVMLDLHWKATKGSWQGIRHVFKYLAGTPDYGLSFKRSSADLTLSAYVTDNFKPDKLSSFAYLFLLCGMPVSWLSTGSTYPPQTEVESKCIALTELIPEARILRQTLQKMGMSDSAVPVAQDAARKLCIPSNVQVSSRSNDRKAQMSMHYISRRLKSGEIKLVDVTKLSQFACVVAGNVSADIMVHMRDLILQRCG